MHKRKKEKGERGKEGGREGGRERGREGEAYMCMDTSAHYNVYVVHLGREA